MEEVLVYYASAGETFDSIAGVVYGDEDYAHELYAANPLLVDKSVFTGGEIVFVPVIPVTTRGDEGRAASTAPWA